MNRGWDPIIPWCGETGGGCPSQSAIRPWDWGFHTVLGGVDLGELDFRPRGVGVVDIGCMNRGWSPIIHGYGGTGGVVPRAGGRGGLGQWGWGSENAGMKAICLMYYKGSVDAARYARARKNTT